MSLLGDVGDPVKDAAAFQPVIEKFAETLGDELAKQVVPALAPVLTDAVESLVAAASTSGIAAVEGMLRRVFDGVTVTINLKPK